MKNNELKITIVYDNEIFKEGLEADWGFSCLVEAFGRKILFDTGAKGAILLGNMNKLALDPAEIDEIFISHDHWDHTGGLLDLLRINPVKVSVPGSFSGQFDDYEFALIKEPSKIHNNIYSTGELENNEQSLIIKTESGVVVVVGCSHPGVESILSAASRFGKVKMVLGGLHGFSDLDLISDLEFICPVHCTKHRSEIESRYPEKYVAGGAGRVIEI